MFGEIRGGAESQDLILARSIQYGSGALRCQAPQSTKCIRRPGCFLVNWLGTRTGVTGMPPV